LTLVTGNPTVPTNCRAGKSLNLNLKVNLMAGQLVNTERPMSKTANSAFAVQVSRAQRHDRPELASGNAAE
jgi:hypothetical protein